MTTVARVAANEAEMLAVARALVTPAYASIEATLGSQLPLTTMGPSAMGVLQSTLAKGIVKMLARFGGARPRIRPSSGVAKPTRVFEVRGTPQIAFSPYTFELLRWLTVTPLHAKDCARFEATPRTLGDELCAYLTLRLVEGRRLERVVASSPGLRTALTWLGFVRPLARYGGEGADAPSLETLLTTEDGRIILECLAGDLARRWTMSIRWDEDDVLDPEQAVRIGTFERGVLQEFLDEVEKAGRWDLATFLIEAAARALPRGASPREVAARAAPRVRTEGTLRARTEARRRAGALFHALGRLGKKREELALVRFIDDDYETAQATLSSWEMLGRDGFTRAEGVVSALDSLEAPAAERGAESASSSV